MLVPKRRVDSGRLGRRMPFQRKGRSSGAGTGRQQLPVQVDQFGKVVLVEAVKADLGEALELALGAHDLEMVAVRRKGGRQLHVLDRAQVDQRLERLGGFLGGAEELRRHHEDLLLEVRRGGHDHEVSGRDAFCMSDERFIEDARDVGDLLRREDEVAQLTGAVLTAGDAGERIGPDDQFDDDAEELAGPANRPKQIAVFRFGGIDDVAGGSDHFGRDDVLGAKADDRRVDADAAVDEVRDNADGVAVADSWS